jgi:hypothetical protein
MRADYKKTYQRVIKVTAAFHGASANRIVRTGPVASVVERGRPRQEPRQALTNCDIQLTICIACITWLLSEW